MNTSNELSQSSLIKSVRETGVFLPVYFFLALINLTAKLNVTPAWFDGTLERNHSLLLAFNYTNNEQSRLFQFLIPEGLRWLGLSVEHAYLVQRWAFVWLAFSLFHIYLRKWFFSGLSFAGVCFFAAILPLSYWNDLQESSPFLMVTFLCALWAIRERRLGVFTVILLIGALNNETILCLPALVFFTNYTGYQLKQLWPPFWKTLLSAAPAFLASAVIRYITRHQPHLGGAWHFEENLDGIISGLIHSPIEYWRTGYLYPIFIFGGFWVYAFRGLGRKPDFLFWALVLVPFFIFPHLVTGISFEVRQMIPLAYIIIPSAMFWLFKRNEDAEMAPKINAALSGAEPKRSTPEPAGATPLPK
jgi:hypothetical protein